MAHRYKRVHIPTNSENEVELGTGSTSGIYFHSDITRQRFLEVINDWNRLTLLQANVTGKVDWLYIAL